MKNEREEIKRKTEAVWIFCFSGICWEFFGVFNWECGGVEGERGKGKGGWAGEEKGGKGGDGDGDGLGCV